MPQIPQIPKQEGEKQTSNLPNQEATPQNLVVIIYIIFLMFLKGGQNQYYQMPGYGQIPGMMPQQYYPYGGYQSYPNQYQNPMNPQSYQENISQSTNQNETQNNQSNLEKEGIY